MEVKVGLSGAIYVRLSRRNLLSLLAKLDGSPTDSHCELYRECNGTFLSVKAEEDAEHYGARTPGEIHPATEREIARKA